MSDFRAIAGVSATLQALLYDRMERPPGVADVQVTIGPPRFAANEGAPVKEDERVNLFLYRVTESAWLENQEPPGRGSSGYGFPPLSLNLHYLLSAYGNEAVNQFGANNFYDDKIAHALLGSAMRVLHEYPIVTEQIVTTRAPSGLRILDSSLRAEQERVKVTLEPLTLEDVSKIWTALTLRYRLSAAYAVNVVQIESRRPRTFPRPVGEPVSRYPPPPGAPPEPGPNVRVFTIRPPTLTDLRVRRAGGAEEQPYPYARLGDTLVLRGAALSGGETVVSIGEVDVPVAGAADDRVEVSIPDASVPGGGAIPPERQLQPGVRPVSVSVRDPAVPGAGLRSNELSFLLIPSVAPASLALAQGPPRTLSLSGKRLIAPGERGQTVVGRVAIPASDYLVRTPLQITVPLPDTLPARGVFLVASGALPDPVVLGGVQALDVGVAGAVAPVSPNLPPSVPRAELPALLQAALHDAAPAAPPAARAALAGARVSLRHDRLIVVLDGLFPPFTLTSPPGRTTAADLGFTAQQPPGNGSALLSGALRPFPALPAPVRVAIRLGGAAPVALAFPPPASLPDAADALEAAIVAAGGGASFTGALVAASGDQLLVVPGAAATVEFAPLPVDPASVAALQLGARHAVRVRVNGAESIDDASVELPP
jgi:hypothetical protein